MALGGDLFRTAARNLEGAITERNNQIHSLRELAIRLRNESGGLDGRAGAEEAQATSMVAGSEDGDNVSGARRLHQHASQNHTEADRLRAQADALDGKAGELEGGIGGLKPVVDQLYAEALNADSAGKMLF